MVKNASNIGKLNKTMLLKNTIKLKRILSFLLIIIAIQQFEASSAEAFLKIPAIFSRNMILQREKPVTVWGSTSAATSVTVLLNNESVEVLSDAQGRWEVSLNPLPVGGPYQMTIATKDTTVTFTNILSGDIYLCSGQSNMAWQFMNDQFYTEESANTDIPNLRSIRIPVKISVDSINDDVGSTYWLQTNETSAKLFSAIGFYFGRKLHQEINVPIGLIGSYWGGSTIEAWMSRDGLSEFSEFDAFLDELETGNLTVEELSARADENLRLKQEGVITDPAVPLALQHFASTTYNGMIAPFRKFAIKGVIWYHGENNVARAWQYRSLFPALIKDWRQKFNNPDMPFYYVQLPNYGLVRNYPHESQWAELREAQDKTLSTNNTEQVISIDIGDCGDLHPKNKRDVGYRLANKALKNIYNRTDINPEFPRLKFYEVVDHTIVCEFEHVGTGLKIKGGELTEFTIAGENEVFVTASANIIAPNKIELSSQFVPNPVAVRYAWSYCPIGGLVHNSNDLPLGTFRTDEWRISTQPVASNLADTIVMQTAKAVNSEITLLLAASGTGELSIDWGDGNTQTVENVSTQVSAPTTVKGVTKVNQAEIKIYTTDRSILYLTCASNELTMLDVSKASFLQYLRCNTNTLSAIELNNNKELLTLHIYRNNLTALNVANNSKLTDLQFGTNKISSLIGLEKLTAVRTLSAMTNPLGEIDVSFNPALQILNLRDCKLTKLDLSKTTNTLTTVEVFNNGHIYSNKFSACGLDSLYHSLPDRTGMTKGVIRVISSIANPLYNDGAGSNKNIANAKNWDVMTYVKETITGDGKGCAIDTGLNTFSDENGFKLHPNPVNDFFSIQIPPSLINESLTVFDFLGRKIKDVKLLTVSTEVNITDFLDGVYYLRIGNYSNKLVVQK